MRARVSAGIVGALLVLAAQQPRAQDAAAPIGGVWVGVFHSYPHFIRMELRLPSQLEDGTTEAELRLEPLVQTRTVGRAPTGLVRVSAAFDRAARTLTLTPAADSYRVLGSRLASFSGVMDRETGLIGGVLSGAAASGSPYFVFGRSEVAESAFLARLRAAISPAAASRPAARSRLAGVAGLAGLRGNSGNPLNGGGPPPEKLLEWAGRLTEELPDVDPYRTTQDRIFLTGRNLFRDEYFQPFFGKRYDELGHADLQRITMAINKVPRPRANFPEERANGALHAVGRGFSPTTGTYASADITLSVIAMRPIAAWRTQSLRQLESVRGTVDALKVVGAVGRAESEVLGAFWPSERKAFETVVAASRARVAEPALAQRVDELLSGATSFSAVPQLADALVKVSTSRGAPDPARARPARPGRRMPVPSAAPPGDVLSELMALVTPEAREAQKARLESRISELVAQEAGRDRDALTRLGEGVDGLQAGGRWRAEAEAKYRAVSSHPSVQALFQDLADRRSPLLRASEQTLAARIQAARSTSDLDQILGAYLRVPSDGSDPAGGRLLHLARKHGEQLRVTEQAVAVKQAEEKRQAASACASASSDNGPDGLPGEPTERDMCMAIERVLLGAQQGMADMQEECRGLNAKSNPVAALTCLMGSASQVGGGPQMSLRGFQKIACSPAASAGRPGFFCDYVAQLRTANAMTAPLINRMGGEISTARFVKSRGAWTFLPPKS